MKAAHGGGRIHQDPRAKLAGRHQASRWPVSSDSRVITASGTAPSNGRHVAVADEHRAHAGALRAVHVVVGPVADEHAAAGSVTPTAAIAARNASGCGLAQGSRCCRRRRRSGASTSSRRNTRSCALRGHIVLDSTPTLMPRSRKSPQQRDYVRVGERMRVPGGEVAPPGTRRWASPRPGRTRRPAWRWLRLVADLPQGQFGGQDGRGHLVTAAGEVRRAHLAPEPRPGRPCARA